jgi:NAD(P)-dependent dehydrogenase (short-subunit alcohol dehydrogenase family)
MAKVWFITGSNVGLGRSITESALAAGDQVVATTRKPASLQDLQQRYGDRLHVAKVDVTDFEQIKAAVAAGVDAFGRIDVVVSNAGFGGIGSVEDMPLDLIASQIDTNFMGAVRLAKATLPVLRAQGGGRIIFISSIGARISTAGAASYYASKAALSALVDSLAEEVKPFGISVTALEPGAMRTNFAQDSSLQIAPSQAIYDQTVGLTAAMMKSPDFAAAMKDPQGYADVVLELAAMEEPPIRLLAGAGAFEWGTGADAARAAADAKWRELSLRADGAVSPKSMDA